MSDPTCCCCVSLDRCDRCDLLVGLEGFDLIAVARRECGLVLDIESCDRCAGCPGCGVIAQGHGRVVVEVIDARPGPGSRQGSGGINDAGYAAKPPARSRPLSSRTTRCAHPGRVWGPGRSAGRSDSCASKEPALQDWPDNWQPRGIPCGPISSRVCKPHLMTPPVSQGFGCWGLMSMCGITRTDAAGAHVSSPASWT